MPRLLVRWLVTTLAILAVPHLVSGVRVDSLGTALAAAAILGILNTLVRPLLVILTFPLTFLSLGLFLLVINALIFQWAGSIVSGMQVDSFGSAFVAALIVSLVSWTIDWGTGGKKVRRVTIYRGRRPPFHPGSDSREPSSDAIDLKRDADDKWE